MPQIIKTGSYWVYFWELSEEQKTGTAGQIDASNRATL